MLAFTAHSSAEDQSVNFTAPIEGGMFEARYVRRAAHYMIAYLSSHAGCDQACRMCHLTQTRQTSGQVALLRDYSEQAARVLQHYDEHGIAPAAWVNFNFMARGEPFLNPAITENWRGLHIDLSTQAQERRLEAMFNISTIMPKAMPERALGEMFPDGYNHNVQIFYSLYSLRPDFRKRWLPYAMDPYQALDRLAEWQTKHAGKVVLHWSFIEGENDDVETVDEIVAAVRERGIKARFNLVRYNPYSPAQGKEPNLTLLSDRLNRLRLGLGEELSRMVPRVGFDVKASCGMFMEA